MLKKLSAYFNTHFIFLLIGLFLISLLTRFYKLNQIPTTLTHDETVYAIQAKSLAVQGKTVNQKLGWFPLEPVDPMYAEWPASIMAPAFWLTSNPLLAAHLPSAIMGSLIPFLLGAIVWAWWKNKRLVFFVIFASAFNPFLWQFSRLAYDAIYSTFFYLLGGAILLNGKKWWQLLSAPFFVIGFFQYQGFKLLLLPWIISLILISYFSKKEKFNFKKIVKDISLAQWLVAIFGFSLVLIYGLFMLPHQNTGNRLASTIWNNTSYLSNEVNILRRLSFDSALNKFEINKFTVMFNFIFNRFFNTFNPQRMFFALDASVNGFAAWRHGLFYMADALLILLGMRYLLADKKKINSAVVFLFLIASLTFPVVINTMSEWYELRAFMVYVLLAVLVGAGMHFVSQYKYIFTGLLIIYLISIFNFTFHYFVQYPVYSADTARFVERSLARYINLNQEQKIKKPVVVVAEGTDLFYFFATYLLQTNQFTKTNSQKIAQAVNEQTWQLNDVKFKASCINSKDVEDDKIILYENRFNLCAGGYGLADRGNEQIYNDVISIPAINDSGEIFRIYNDQLCQNEKLGQFINPKNLTLFDLGKLNSSQFCQAWLTDLHQL